MSEVLRPSIAACPACVVGPAAVDLARRPIAKDKATLLLSLPTIHCGACMSKVERALEAHAGVTSARVNLTLRRASVEAGPEVQPSDLIKTLADIGYEAHELDASALSATTADRAGREILMRLAVAGFASMNVMLLSVAIWSGASDATRDMFHWLSAAIALPAVAFSAQPFFKNAWAALRKRRMNMDVPIALAILLALATSLNETARGGEHAYFDAALTLTFFLLAGRYLDHRSRSAARSAAQELTALEVPRATRIVDGQEQDIPVADLEVGDLLCVRPGGRMPVDGVVVEGESEIDRSLITGETLPVFAGPDCRVSAGEINLSGPLILRATAVGAETSLQRMADLVAMAESGRSRYTSLADQAAQLYAPGVHILAGLAFFGWYLYSGDLRLAVNIAAAVLIITCPCALGLAVPAVTTAASGRLFRQGLLIKDSTALERLAEVDTVVFDKTGTLTEGAPELCNLGEHSQKNTEIALALAAASAHPLALALRQAAVAAGVVAAGVTGIKEVPGYGIEGFFEGQLVRLGRPSWTGGQIDETGSETQTASFLKIGDAPAQAFVFQDRLRAGAQTAVQELIMQGKTVHLLSGDTIPAVRGMAKRLGIEHWTAQALPEEKAKTIQKLSQKGKVLMIGDGLNDTVALSTAHVSISPATALDAARVASDIVLLGSDLAPIPNALRIAQKTTRRIRENFRIATLYNLIAVPLAIAGLATPLVAALAMSTSSITVSLNALRLR